MHETSIMLHMVSIFKSLMLSGISLISLVVTSFLSLLIDTKEITQAPPKISFFSYEAVLMQTVLDADKMACLYCPCRKEGRALNIG